MARGARVVVEQDPRIEEPLTATASGSTSLPLSDRETAWDAGAAKKSLGEGQYPQAHFWRDPDGDPETLAAYKLPFASAASGTLTAIWRGVTASAGAVQGARGGVQIPESDVGGVKSRIASYYRKAAKKYDDPTIKAPWDTSAAESAALLEAYGWEGDTDVAPAAVALAHAEAVVDQRVFDDRLAFWSDQLASTIDREALARRVPDPPLLAEPTDEEHPMPPEHQPRDERPRRRPTPNAPAVDAMRRASQARWEAVLAPEGRATEDGRIFAPGAIAWRDLPLSLMALLETPDEGHTGAQLAGRIDRIWRDEKAGLIRGEGVFDDGDFGREVARLVGDRTLTGNSVDLAILSYEVGSRSDYVDEDGNWIPDEAREAARDEGEEPRDLLDILFAEDEEPIFVVREAVIGMSTVCPFPAFAEAEISLAADGTPWVASGDWSRLHAHLWIADAFDLADGLTAAAAGLAPERPPAAWFEPPELDELTPLTVTEEGHLYGHAAAWEACHIALPGCTVAPTSDCDYAYFHLKEVETDEGERVACGTITLDTGHAARHLGRQDATRHYDDTGTAVADVVVGEDEYGIWVAGALRPEVDAAKARKLRGSALSGDWRRVNGNLELVALLAVNVPGFPVPRAKALVAAGEDGAEVLTLVAAGVHDGRTPNDLTAEQRARLAALSARAVGGLEGLAALATRAA